MTKRNVCILFGGDSPEHEISLRSAEFILNQIDTERNRVFPVGITREGKWLSFAGTDYAAIPADTWHSQSGNCPAAVSPIRGQGLLIFSPEGLRVEKIDVVFPVLHGENGEDGAIQGLLKLAGIPFVGPNVAASAVAMDKTLTKLVANSGGIPQADWELVRGMELGSRMDAVVDRLERRFRYPMFVKPAGTGSSVGVSKAGDRNALCQGLLTAARFDSKILVEEFIHGREIEVAVMGNDSPVASICGEIDTGAEFYDYNAKYLSDTSVAYIPARISEDVAERVRELAVKVYQVIGCRGLSRVDFFVTFEDQRVIFNEINTLPGFTSISMFPKLFAASGIPSAQLIDQLLELAQEAIQ